MIENMQTDDALAILSSVGTVSLRRIKDPRSATPGHKPHRGWTCECDVPGYHHNGGGKPIMVGAGGTAREAALACLSAIEDYLASTTAAEQRKRYVDHHAVLKSLWDNAGAEARYAAFNRVHNPGPLVPEARIDWSGDGGR